ncbi:venom allergen 3-like [Cataglyphis hispanica]|uniref:venom allergen 3-like n=1 Tax=Cataglyphis hispanica TaxID=1086592 RepID=UPI00218085F3|nr:venom allergen 3-like [Cataglyphis hispanica]
MRLVFGSRIDQAQDQTGLTDCENADCIDMEFSDLDEEDIETVLHSHNFYRVIIANGKESRGNPGPQPAARIMMELIWDDELAVIARRWALQCKLFETDECRDIERFGVRQNVNVLNMDKMEHSTSRKRIHFHITSWYNEVQHFDNAKIGLVNYSDAALQSSPSYISLASATFIYVGCGRAIYTPDLNKTAATPGRFGNRVEVLVCNYGPVDRTALQQLYKLGRPGLCPSGTFPSDHYQSLCKLCLASHFKSYVSSVFTKMEKVSDRNRLKCKALLLIFPKTIFEIGWKNIKEPMRRDKEAQTVERNSSVS